MTESKEQAKLELTHEGKLLVLTLSGTWTSENSLPSPDLVINFLEDRSDIREICFETSGVLVWNTGFMIFLTGIRELCQKHGISFSSHGLPEGAVRLLLLSRKSLSSHRGSAGSLSAAERLNEKLQSIKKNSIKTLEFIGEASVSAGKLICGRAVFRRTDLMMLLEECGARALPIVTLIAVLIGMILAFVGAVQLEMFGAQIFVADLVGLGMAREMGAMMTAVIMAGRTGAAFAAQLGTMQVNEEVDALTTLGVSPMDFLVVPRMAALVLMMPLLCVYADLMGILGGMFVGSGVLGIDFHQYVHQTIGAIGTMDFLTGVFKSVFFGLIVASCGCYHGIHCGRDSSSVGKAATSAVVSGIVLIIVCDAIFTVLFTMLGI